MAERSNNASFDILLGQDRAKTFFKRTLASGRLAHAYLFRGPDGVGKRLCARLVAARINCLQPTDHGGCGRCSSCRKFISGNQPDIEVISPENGTIKIDRIRELCRSLAYPPYESMLRVVILEDIHTMRTEAANSLLKTLEEPPEGTMLILTGESSREILATIVSRCQVVPFYGLETSQTMEVLSNLRPDLDRDEAHLLARLSGGSPGQALILEEKGLVKIWYEVLEELEGSSAAGPANVSSLLLQAERISALKENLLPFLGLMRLWVRDQMTAADQGDWESGNLQRSRLAALDRAERQLARNCNRNLVCEVLLFDLQSPAPRLSL